MGARTSMMQFLKAAGAGVAGVAFLGLAGCGRGEAVLGAALPETASSRRGAVLAFRSPDCDLPLVGGEVSLACEPSPAGDAREQRHN